MLQTLSLSALLLTAAMSLQAQVDASRIMVRVLNARTGKPAHGYRIYVAFDGAEYQVNQLLPKDGTVTFSGAGHVRMAVSVVGLVTCRDKAITGLDYSVATVASKGYVEDNSCGVRRVEPKPGEFVYYGRPATRWELFRN